MSDIILNTYNFLDYLDTTELIKKLTFYKNKCLSNQTIINLVKKYQSTKNNNELIKIKKELYEYSDYVNYQKYYEELSLVIMEINRVYSKYTNTRKCHCE